MCIIIGKEIEQQIVDKIKNVIRFNSSALPCSFKGIDVEHAEDKDFKLQIDAKVALEIAGVACNFEIHYPEEPQAK